MSYSPNFSLDFSETDGEIPSIKFMPSENHGTFLNELIKEFYNRIINTVSFNNFENLSIEWIMNTLKHNDMNAKIFLELIQNHEIWFSGLIGFFYQHGIGCNVNKDKALEMYLLAIKHDKVQSINNIIAKYLLSLFYYKDIILVKLQDDSNNSENYNQKSKKKMNKSNDDALDFSYQYEKETKPDEKTKFVQYAIFARGGNIIGFYYEYGKGINKDEKKAFEWYLKSAEAGNSIAQYNLGRCYKHGIGTNKDVKKAFEWYLESAKNGNSGGQNNLGHCYQYGIGVNVDE